MRRLLIQGILPLLFCAVPLAAAALIGMAIPAGARDFYLHNFSSMDGLILGLGSALFVVQVGLCWRTLLWRGTSFDQRPDRWLTNLAQAAEWFPLLGLIGTVAGILDTFGNIGDSFKPSDIIHKYAPAITATGSGLVMSLINILPSWVVLLGRDLILSISGAASSKQ